MKLLIAGLLAASTIAVTLPAAAQSFYIGPRSGVGFGGVDPYRDGYFRDGGRSGRLYEGRSVYRDPHRSGYDLGGGSDYIFQDR